MSPQKIRTRQGLQFQLMELLGEGGNGKVYKGTKLGTAGFSKTMAIKFLHGGNLSEKNLKNHMISEAKILGMLSHNNIVGVYELDEYEDSVLIAMEFVEGFTLETMLNCNNGPLPLPVAVSIVLDICKALNYIHRFESDGNLYTIIHCDISLANILFNIQTKTPKLADFGFSKVTQQGRQLHVSPPIIGNIYYISPEHVRSEWIDERSDIYSLGAVFYDLLLCCRSFDVKLEEAMNLARRGRMIDRDRLSVLPKTLCNIVHKMTYPNPGGRYQSVADLIVDLEEFSNTLGSPHKIARANSEFFDKIRRIQKSLEPTPPRHEYVAPPEGGLPYGAMGSAPTSEPPVRSPLGAARDVGVGSGKSPSLGITTRRSSSSTPTGAKADPFANRGAGVAPTRPTSPSDAAAAPLGVAAHAPAPLEGAQRAVSPAQTELAADSLAPDAPLAAEHLSDPPSEDAALTPAPPPRPVAMPINSGRSSLLPVLLPREEKSKGGAAPAKAAAPLPTQTAAKEKKHSEEPLAGQQKTKEKNDAQSANAPEKQVVRNATIEVVVEKRPVGKAFFNRTQTLDGEHEAPEAQDLLEKRFRFGTGEGLLAAIAIAVVAITALLTFSTLFREGHKGASEEPAAPNGSAAHGVLSVAITPATSVQIRSLDTNRPLILELPGTPMRKELPPGHYRLEARQEGAAPFQKDFEIKAGETQEIRYEFK